MSGTSNNFEYNFVFSKSGVSQYKHNNPLNQVSLKPPGREVKRIVIFCESDSRFAGFQLFDKDGLKLYEPSYSYSVGSDFNSKEIILKEGERIIGVKSRTCLES